MISHSHAWTEWDCFYGNWTYKITSRLVPIHRYKRLIYWQMIVKDDRCFWDTPKSWFLWKKYNHSRWDLCSTKSFTTSETLSIIQLYQFFHYHRWHFQSSRRYIEQALTKKAYYWEISRAKNGGSLVQWVLHRVYSIDFWFWLYFANSQSRI